MTPKWRNKSIYGNSFFNIRFETSNTIVEFSLFVPNCSKNLVNVPFNCHRNRYSVTEIFVKFSINFATTDLKILSSSQFLSWFIPFTSHKRSKISLTFSCFSIALSQGASLNFFDIRWPWRFFHQFNTKDKTYWRLAWFHLY